MTNPIDDQSSSSEVFIGSKQPADNKYGQNGYHGASSDLPGQHTTSGFLPQSNVPKDGWQTRDVSVSPLAPAHGMRNRSAVVETISSHNLRRK